MQPDIDNYLEDFDDVASMLVELTTTEPKDRGAMMEVCCETFEHARRDNGFSIEYPLDIDLLPLEVEVMERHGVEATAYMEMILQTAVVQLGRITRSLAYR